MQITKRAAWIGVFAFSLLFWLLIALAVHLLFY